MNIYSNALLLLDKVDGGELADISVITLFVKLFCSVDGTVVDD